MRFSQLISSLKESDAGLKSHHLKNDPEILSGASIEKADINQITFLEKDNSLVTELLNCSGSAVLLPDQADLYIKADKQGLAWAVFKDPKLAFAETLDLLNPSRNPNPGIHKTSVIGEKSN